MIEVVYKEEKKEAVGNEGFFRVPKNIRQVGEPEGDYKIYIEDYAYHYLDRMSEDASEGKAALLLGRSNWSEGVTYIFIKGAFALEQMEVDRNHIVFREEVWAKANEVMEESFPGQAIVGWFFTMPECALEITETMYRAHLNYFAGNDKVFFMKEPTDQEEAFFLYENGRMCRQPGYYLYYERNEMMQEFIIASNEKSEIRPGEQVPDTAVQDFRKIIAEKKEKLQIKGPSRYMYASAAAAVLLALLVGTTYLNSYQKMKDANQAAGEFSAQLVEEPLEEKVSKEQEAAAVPTGTAGQQGQENRAQAEEMEDGQENIDEGNREESGDSWEDTEDEEEAGTLTPTPTAEETPQPADFETSVDPESAVEYEIQPGDTLTIISNMQYGNPNMVDAICALNHMAKEEIIYPGETLLLP